MVFILRIRSYEIQNHPSNHLSGSLIQAHNSLISIFDVADLRIFYLIGVQCMRIRK